jgi:hypothetical protein
MGARKKFYPQGDSDVRTATIATTILLAGLFGAGAGQAQLWRGPAALEIEAKDQKGGPVAGGQAKLVCRSIEPADGPPPVTLDGKGRAVVSGLAEGKWHVEVTKDGYMTFQADLDVNRDRKPKTLSTLQLNVPHAVHMMDVLFYKAKPSPEALAAVPEPRPEPRRPAAPAPRPTPPAPVPEPAPAPPVEIPAATAPTPAPEPAPAAPRPAAPEPPRPAPAPPVPAPPPPNPVPAPSAMAPTPAPTAAPTAPYSVRRRSFEDRTCFECKPGESALSLEAVVPPGAEGCGAAVRDLLTRTGDTGLPAGCRVLRVSLPAGTHYTGYRYEIQEGGDGLDCQAGKDCPGGGRWPLEPALTKSTAGTTIAAAFEGGPGVTRERHAVLTVYYAMQGRK